MINYKVEIKGMSGREVFRIQADRVVWSDLLIQFYVDSKPDLPVLMVQQDSLISMEAQEIN